MYLIIDSNKTYQDKIIYPATISASIDKTKKVKLIIIL